MRNNGVNVFSLWYDETTMEGIDRIYFAAVDTYNCGTYGRGEYSNNDCANASNSTTTTSDGGILGPLTGVGPVITSPYFILGAVIIVISIGLTVLIRRHS
jgi:hypothetical protein